MIIKLKAISGLLLIFCHVFAVVLFVIYFQFNRDYIAQNLCKNRIYKSNTCQGQCYFKETLSILEGEGSDDHFDILVILDNYLVPDYADTFEAKFPLFISGYQILSCQFLYRHIHSSVDSPPPEMQV